MKVKKPGRRLTLNPEALPPAPPAAAPRPSDDVSFGVPGPTPQVPKITGRVTPKGTGSPPPPVSFSVPPADGGDQRDAKKPPTKKPPAKKPTTKSPPAKKR